MEIKVELDVHATYFALFRMSIILLEILNHFRHPQVMNITRSDDKILDTVQVVDESLCDTSISRVSVVSNLNEKIYLKNLCKMDAALAHSRE